MKKILSLTALAVGASLLVTVPVAAGGHSASPAEKAIKARKAVMQLYSYSLGTLGGMAKGSVDYDAKAAQSAADNLMKMASYDQSTLWPKGTDSVSMAGKTRAKAEIWSTYPEVAEKGKALVTAATALAEAAGKDLASLQAAIGPVGASCGGCHKPFRTE